MEEPTTQTETQVDETTTTTQPEPKTEPPKDLDARLAHLEAKLGELDPALAKEIGGLKDLLAKTKAQIAREVSSTVAKVRTQAVLEAEGFDAVGIKVLREYWRSQPADSRPPSPEDLWAKVKADPEMAGSLPKALRAYLPEPEPTPQTRSPFRRGAQTQAPVDLASIEAKDPAEYIAKLRALRTRR